MTSGGGGGGRREGEGGREGHREVLMMSNKRAQQEVTSGSGSVEEVLNEDDVQLCVSLWTDATAMGGRRKEATERDSRMKEEKGLKEEGEEGKV